MNEKIKKYCYIKSVILQDRIPEVKKIKVELDCLIIQQKLIQIDNRFC